MCSYTNGQLEACDVDLVHPDSVEAARSALATAPVQELADTFRALGDPTRVKILLALQARELCVCDLVELFEITQSAVSHQLRILRNHRLVRARREGKLVYYSLDDDHVRSLFEEGLRHVREETG